ncbi:MAG: C-GCAxxG-C-C family protein, partial [Desulfovibrio sp.]|nr:C-GCAxxG-C-C family protein [Desulfovibrio sp.]
RMLERESHDLLYASNGLCYGIGQSNGPCGLLTGGALSLSLLLEQKTPQQRQPILNDYALGFEETTSGIIRCGEISQSPSPDPMACGELLSLCWEKILTLLQEYEISVEPC